MNSIMGIQITDDGMLQVQYFPCCDWVDVGNISQIAQTATATGNKTSFKDAVTAGFKNLVGNLPEIPNAESSFNNPSTLKCVKATAIITVVQAMFNDILNQLQSMGGTEALIASLWATALDELGLKALATPFSIVAAANKYGVSGLADLIEDILGNSAFWESSICSLSYQMEAYNAITGKDMASFYSLMTQNTVIAAEEILDILDFIVPGEFQQSVTMQLSGTTCGCTALLPYAYTPPAAPGFHIDRLSFFGAGAVINAYPDLSGQVLEYPSTFTPPVGETAAAQGFKTTYVGVSAGAHITKACVIYASPGLETFLLSQIKAGFTHSGGAISQWSANAYGYRPDTGLWVNLAFLTESSPVADAQKSWLFSGVNINRVAICTKVLGVPTTGAPAYVTFNNLLFTGNIAGVGFVDLPAGQSPS